MRILNERERTLPGGVLFDTVGILGSFWKDRGVSAEKFP
jgi:hypothetical protein